MQVSHRVYLLIIRQNWFDRFDPRWPNQDWFLVTQPSETAKRNRARKEKPAHFVQLLQQVNKSIPAVSSSRGNPSRSEVSSSQVRVPMTCCLSADNSPAQFGVLPKEVRKSMQRALIHGKDLNAGFAPDEAVLIAFYTYLLASLAGSSFPSLDKD